jgi:hypothetical protein
VGVGAREAVEVEVEVEAPWDWDASSSTYCRLQPFSSLSFNSSPLFFFLFTPSPVLRLLLFYVVSRVFTAQTWVSGHFLFCIYYLPAAGAAVTVSGAALTAVKAVRSATLVSEHVIHSLAGPTSC